jgi:hypothetical protein
MKFCASWEDSGNVSWTRDFEDGRERHGRVEFQAQGKVCVKADFGDSLGRYESLVG